MVELRRVTSDAAATECDSLFRDYLAWLVVELRASHGIDLTEESVARAHREFRQEWPKLFGDRGRMYVATIDGEPVGVGTLKPVSEREVELKRLYVRPEARGAGVGRILMARLIDDARRMGYHAIRLETFSFMTHAQGLYRSFGFVADDMFEGAEGSGHGTTDVELFMTLRI